MKDTPSPSTVLACLRCGGRMSVIATIEAADVLRQILGHLGLPTDPPAPFRPVPLPRSPISSPTPPPDGPPPARPARACANPDRGCRPGGPGLPNLKNLLTAALSASYMPGSG